MWPGLVHYYRNYLPVTESTPIVTLNEGNTPLIKLENLPKKMGIHADWYVKFEGLNPTGSFKDRGMTMAMTKAKEAGARMVMCASTGNTSASAAAYATRGGMACCVIIPDGKIALGKLSQAMMHGALVLQIEGNFDDALKLVRDITHEMPITLVNSVNPYRIEGQKTGAFEVIEALGDAPDFHFIPVGNAGNITAYWKGYTEFFALQKSTKKPKMMGYQAAGSAPIVFGKPITNPQTIATAIQIGNPASWEGATKAKEESGGHIDAVTDDEITEAQKLLASLDGVFCEPASAASVAGVLKYAKTHAFEKGQTIVSVLTGHGLKDPNRAIEISSRPLKVSSNKTAIYEVLKPYLE
jgi:threonine synthase